METIAIAIVVIISIVVLIAIKLNKGNDKINNWEWKDHD